MSPDENFLLFLSIGGSAWLWGRWYWQIHEIPHLVSLGVNRTTLSFLPLITVAILLPVLNIWADQFVRDSGDYTILYLLFGTAWVGLGVQGWFPWLGLSIRDDVIEGRNSAAIWAIGGGLLGLTFCFAGGNIGNGPGWWVVLFSALLSTGGFIFIWLIFSACTRIIDSVTIDRDLGASLRFGGLLTAVGLIFGRAVAGDWISVIGTIDDFIAVSWPTLILLTIAIVIEKRLSPSPQHPQSPVKTSVIAVSLYLCVAFIQLILVGPWS